MPSYTADGLLESIHQMKSDRKIQQEILEAELKNRQKREQIELEQLRQKCNKEEVRCDDFAGSQKNATNFMVANGLQYSGRNKPPIAAGISISNVPPNLSAPAILSIYNHQLSEFFFLNRNHQQAIKNQFFADPNANIQPPVATMNGLYNLRDWFDQRR